MSTFRTEKDSMGEVQVPEDALYAAQTQRAIDNFPISNLPMPREFIRALGLVKEACAKGNESLSLLSKEKATAIVDAANKIQSGEIDNHFPIDIFQTGSGTSSNMNTNEVIANLAKAAGKDIHPNDDVNQGQSSNDVIPTSIHVSASLFSHEHLIPKLEHLCKALQKREKELSSIAKTGRTHLMDAMPVTFGQELSGWRSQIESNINRIRFALIETQTLPIGGTAVGTGINSPKEFGSKVCEFLSKKTNVKFTPSKNRFEHISAQDAAVSLSGALKATACSLMKIANDLRWMNSGPLAGIGEIELPSLQPGSSIMPGKVNPVVAESVAMVCAQVIGNDTTITIAGQSGNFQLNVMLPVIAYNLLQSIEILGNSATILADNAIAGFKVNERNINERLSRNPILVTALNTVIGYELGAKIAKTAYKEGKPLINVALEMTDLDKKQLEKLLDPNKLTEGGIPK
jgi:fumarate hydratase class II